MHEAELLYRRYKTRRDGECQLWTRGRHGDGRYGGVFYCGFIWMAHRLLYTLSVGPIPEGLHLHHLCGNKLCVNPKHLRPVTPQEHVDLEPAHYKHRRQCPRGHEYTPENTRLHRKLHRNGREYLGRFCRECNRIAIRARDAKRRAARSGATA
jgi:hypothetical protein